MLYMTKSLSNKLYLKKQLYELRMNEGAAVLEYLNFFNKVISDFYLFMSRSMRRTRCWYFSVRFQSHMNISSPPCSKVRKLSFWRTLRQLSYLIRFEKCQIKRSRQDRVWWSREGKERKREGKKGPGSSKACHFCHREGHWKNDCKHRQEWLKKMRQAAEAGIALNGLEKTDVLMASYKDNTS